MTNSTTLTGNLTRDPEVRYTRDGQAAVNFGLAVTRRWRSRTSDEWEESTSFFDIVCWRELAENIALSLTKGMRVIVTGRMEQRTWENDEGERRYKVEVIAEEVGPSLRFATAEVMRIERLEQSGHDSDEDAEVGGNDEGPSSSTAGRAEPAKATNRRGRKASSSSESQPGSESSGAATESSAEECEMEVVPG
ncbi:MAG: single-stranded DNA-binding protein [Acidimicrobiales bacterium]